jgi:DnaJ-class molecular chaperone
MAGEFSYYDLLGVKSSATQAEIHTAYRLSLLRYHPDTNSAPNAMRLTEMLNEAHRVLSTTVRRAAYDATLSSPGPTPDVSRQSSHLSGVCAALFFPWLLAWGLLPQHEKRGDVRA